MNRFDLRASWRRRQSLCAGRRCRTAGPRSGEGDGDGAAAADAVKRVMEYIDRYFYQELTWSGWQREVHMHPNHFGNLSRKDRGQLSDLPDKCVGMEKARSCWTTPI